MRPKLGDGRIGVVAVAVVALAAGPALATTWVVPDPAKMADAADAVVLATVEEIRSVESFDRSQITTEVVLHVQEGYKGAVAGERVVLHEVGGTVGEDVQWAFGSPEYRVGETVVAYVERAGGGRLRTQHMAIGKLEAEILDDGRVVLSGIREGGGRKRQLLSTFERGFSSARRQARGAVRLAGRLQPNRPRLEGISQAQSQFRLMEPGSRWFDLPVAIWGDLAGDKGLGKTVANRVVEGAAGAWNGHAGSAFEATYAGNKNAPGFVCNPGYITVSFDDPKEQVGDPSGCGGGALAVGGFCATASNHGGSPYREITSGAVVFNDGWQNCWFWNEKNLKEILAHELGHAIGFAHSWDAHLGSTNDPFVVDATMFWMAHFDGRGASVTDYEKGAVAYLYDDEGQSAPNPTPTPAPAPTPAPNADDADGDGVDNAQDNCPDMPNSLQRDADDDGVGDACDACDSSSDPDETCSTLEGIARIVVNDRGKANATVRVTFAPWMDDLQQDMDVELVMGDRELRLSLSGDDVKVNSGGTVGRLAANKVIATIRKYGEETRLTLRVKNDALADLVDDDEDLLVRISTPGHGAAGVMSCITRTPDRRQVTKCRM